LWRSLTYLLRSGRLVAGYFETLPSRDEDPEYYKQTKMPIALDQVEEKLDKGEFADLSELESYIKRMIINAKEYYPRHSQIYEDAERVRKATSNYMTKNNPAYQTRGYQAQPTPLPPEDDDEQESAEAGANADADADADAEAEDEPENSDEPEEPDAEGEDDEDAPGEEEVEEEAEDEDADGDEEEQEEEDEVVASKPSIVIRRRARGRNGNEYEGLTFQQAQEKIVDEILNKQEDEL